MAGSIILGVLSVFGALAILWAIFKIIAMSGLTASLVFNLGFAAPPPPAMPPPPPPVYAPAPASAAPVAPATPVVSSDTKLIMETLASMDLRQQGRDGKQDERIGRLEDHLRSTPSGPSPCSSCDSDGRVSGVQKIRAH